MALIEYSDNVPKEKVLLEGVHKAQIQWLVGEKEDPSDFYMRKVTVAPGGMIALHNHEALHEIYILSGKGAVIQEGADTPVEPGYFAYVPAGEKHGFKNTGSEDFIFICCINKV